MIEIVVIGTASPDDRSYLVSDGTVALVVDPGPDIGRVLVTAAEHGVTVTAVFETHLHDGHASGGLALARQTGAAYYLNAADRVPFERIPIYDGDEVAVGAMGMRVVATPGPAAGGLSYVLEDVAGAVLAVFTGGSLLTEPAGLPGTARAQPAAAQEWAGKLAALLPGSTPVLPAHGFRRPVRTPRVSAA